MKRRYVVFYLVVFAMILGSGTAFAKALASPSTTIGTAPISGSVPLSKNVTGVYLGTASTYAATTGHSSGTQTYGTEESSTGIFYKIETPNTTPATLTLDFANTAGWTAK